MLLRISSVVKFVVGVELVECVWCVLSLVSYITCACVTLCFQAKLRVSNTVNFGHKCCTLYQVWLLCFVISPTVYINFNHTCVVVKLIEIIRLGWLWTYMTVVVVVCHDWSIV